MSLFQSSNARAVPTRQQIADRITESCGEKGITFRCPICHRGRWDVAGVLSHTLESSGEERGGTRSFVPTALVICENCAFCAEFSLVTLGLLG